MTKDRRYTIAIVFYKAMRLLMQLLSRLLFLAILLFLFSALPARWQYADQAAFIPQLLAYLQACVTFVHTEFPLQLYHRDMSVPMIIIALFLLKEFIIDNYSYNLANRIDTAYLKRDLNVFKKKIASETDVASLGHLEDSIHAMSLKDKADRQELLRVFAETRKKLESMSSILSFLSLDVVASTAMKKGEDKPSIELSFSAYKKLVMQHVHTTALKSAWTPDGVMICFKELDAAVMAAKNILLALPEFNAKENFMATSFHVRCGVNMGKVYDDDSVPMEEMSDRVIDIAGHMQKYAQADSIYLSEACFSALHADAAKGFEKIAETVDDCQVYCWKAA